MITVRPLAWHQDAFGATADAFGVCAFYKMTGTAGDWTLFVPERHSYTQTPHRHQSEAKAAAQADFEARFLACIADGDAK